MGVDIDHEPDKLSEEELSEVVQEVLTILDEDVEDTNDSLSILSFCMMIELSTCGLTLGEANDLVDDVFKDIKQNLPRMFDEAKAKLN